MEHQYPVQRADEPTAGLKRSGDLTQPASSIGLPKRLRKPEQDVIPHENDKVVAKSLLCLLQGGHGESLSNRLHLRSIQSLSSFLAFAIHCPALMLFSSTLRRKVSPKLST